ncbi:hypothetical protein D6745_03115 [Candidatus Woesearchaeota archaeon]|nr:MAG: hypothetical protein D6745_03115 [Candidatus Woesearchaeota archaeon]
MQNKKMLIFLGLFLLLAASNVFAATNWLTDIFQDASFDPAELYKDYGPFIDFVIYLIIFIGLTRTVFDRVYGTKGGSKAISIGLGIAMSIGLSVWGKFRIGDFGPIVALILILLVGIVLFNLLRKAGLGIGSAAFAFLIVYFILKGALPDVFVWLEQKIPWLGPILGFLVFVCVFLAIGAVLKKITGGGPFSGHSGPRRSFRDHIGEEMNKQRIKQARKDAKRAERELESAKKDEEKEKHELRDFEKLEKKEKRELHEIERDLNVIRDAIHKYGESPEDRAKIITKIHEIFSDAQELQGHTPKMQELLKEIEALEQEAVRNEEKSEAEGEKALEEAPDKDAAKKAKDFEERAADQRKRAADELKRLREELSPLMRRLQFYEQAFPQRIQWVLNALQQNNLVNAIKQIDGCIRYVKGLEEILRKIRHAREKIERDIKKQIHDTRHMKKDEKAAE